MLDAAALRLIFQPIADCASDRAGLSCYDLAEVCAVVFGVTSVALASVFVFEGQILGALLFGAVFGVGFIREDAHRCRIAMWQGRPIMPFCARLDVTRLGFVMLALFSFVMILIDHATLIRVMFVVADLAYPSAQWFLLCRPMTPRPRTERALAAQGAPT